MGIHREFGINVRFQSPSIIKYLEPLMEDLLRPVLWVYFDIEQFQALGGDLKYHYNARKLFGMLEAFQAQDHVLNELNF